jgi:hypothetical protein
MDPKRSGSAILAPTNFVFAVGAGAVGMVLANCCNMAVRIGFAIQVLLSIFPYSSTETDPSRQSPLQGTPNMANQYCTYCKRK